MKKQAKPTPNFISDLGGIGAIFPLIDNAYLEEMFNNRSFQENVADLLMDRSMEAQDASVNAEWLTYMVECGALSTRFSRSHNGFPEDKTTMASPFHKVRFGFK